MNAQQQPRALQVDREQGPNDVPLDEPARFSWRGSVDHRGAGQRAYRVVVGRDRDGVAVGEGDVWDSGRVESDRSTDVPYDGPSLAADATYWWSVRTWDAEGRGSEWAEPAAFATELGDEGDWDGEWLSHQPGEGDRLGWRSHWQPGAGEDADEWVQVDLGESTAVEAVVLHPATPFGPLETPHGVSVTTAYSGSGPDDRRAGLGFPESVTVAVGDDPEFADGTATETTATFDTPTTDAERVSVDATGRYVRVTATELSPIWPVPEDMLASTDEDSPKITSWACFALAGLSVLSDGDDVAQGRPVSASSSVETGEWGIERLVDGVDECRMATTSPLLRTEFDLPGEIERARLHVATLGYGEVYVNGERVGDAVLDPAWTRYGERSLYSTYDVGDALSAGENALGIWLGRGWFAWDSDHLWNALGSPRAIAQLTVTFADGSTRTVATGGDWLATDSPVVDNSIYDGETYDARRERPGWAEPGVDAESEPGSDDGATSESGGDVTNEPWASAVEVDGPGGDLRPQRVQPMEVVQTFEPEAVIDHPDGPILDFGQNLTGWVELQVRNADRGDEVTIRHAEALTDEGDLSTVDLRSADATDTYVARGDEVETYESRFTYHGFRYAQIEGYPGTLDSADVTAKVVHTAMERRGEFDCSNDDLDGVQHNAVWGLRGNTHSVPEDCPQRDERLGWTGDAHIAARALLFNFDALRFHEKWLRDHADCQSSRGHVGDVIPNQLPEAPADPTWSITQVVIPWYLYLHEGDRRVLDRHYENMRRYVDYWHGVSDEGLLTDVGRYGDWLDMESDDSPVGEPRDLFCTAFHYHVTDVFARIAAVVGNDVDAERYRDRAELIAETFRAEFFDPETATFGPGTQASYAVPLFFGLVPEDHVEGVVDNLVETVESDGGKLQTGFLGTRPLVLTLAEHGHADLAYHVVSQPERPGWVYMHRNGATTMWEHWDSDDSVGSGMNSLNHSPNTFVSEWFYEVLAGLRLRDDDRPVTDAVTVAPRLVGDLKRASGRVETPNGDLASAWERTDGGYRLSVSIPWNVDATVRLPEAVDAAVTEGGLPIDETDGVTREDTENGAVVLAVGSGDYEFVVE